MIDFTPNEKPCDKCAAENCNNTCVEWKDWFAREWRRVRIQIYVALRGERNENH